MTLTSIITRTATIALAAAALAAPAASARPADVPPAAAKTATAQQPKQAQRSADVGDYPTRPAQGEQANPRPDAPPQATADSGIAWSMIGLGMAGLLAAAAIVGAVSLTRRSGRARITA